MSKPIEEQLRAKIVGEFSPTYLELINESHMHGLPPEAEKHFKLVLITDEFTGMSRIERHQMVNTLLANELRDHVHALSMQLMTSLEWRARGGEVFASPECLGGGKRHGMNN